RIMSLQLKVNETVSHGMKRIVRKEIDKALAALNSGAEVDRAEAVHDARRAFKKIRAALKLVRHELGNRVYQRENIRYRDAGRPLTEVRDAQVLIETLDKVQERFASECPEASVGPVRAVLREHERTTAARILDEDKARDAVTDVLKTARRHIDDWRI